MLKIPLFTYMRHVSCSLVCWCEGPDPSESILQRNVMMSMKTGKGWIDVKKPELSAGFLDSALTRLEKLYSTMSQRNAQEADVNVNKVCIEKDLFRVLTYQAEAAMAQGDFTTASARIQRCKDMLLRLPKETVFLSILCYNFGVQTYEEKNYEQSSFWLSQSYEIGKSNIHYTNGHEMQAKVLRLLATVYLEWDVKLYQEKALNAIRLANEENPHPAGFFLKMKILLNCFLPDEVISMAASEMLRYQLPLDVYMNTVKILFKHARDGVGFDFLKIICNHFESSPEIEKALLLQIDLLLKHGKIMLARQRVEDLITGHYTGKQLASQHLNYLHVILWDSAAKSFENKSYAEALEWYNYSLSIYNSGCAEPNFAKLQRNRASCFLHLGELSKAKEAITAAEKCDPSNIFTYFILYKIAIQENNILEGFSRHRNSQQELATKALECVAENSLDMKQAFLSLRCLLRIMLSRDKCEDQDQRSSEILQTSDAARIFQDIKKEIDDVIQIALDNNTIDKKTARFLTTDHPLIPLFYCLPKIHKRLDNPPGHPIDTTDFLNRITTLDTLTDNCILATMDITNLYTSIPHDEGIEVIPCKMATHKSLQRTLQPKSPALHSYFSSITLYLIAFCHSGSHRKLAEPLMWERLQEKRITEAHWFRKIAWNLAVNTPHSPSLMRDSFLLSYKISLFCPSDKIVLVAQKSCLMMAAAVDLDIARNAIDHSEQVELFIQSMENIKLCRDIWNNLKSGGDFSNDPSEILLLLYEFEIKAKLNDPGLDSVLECIWELPNLDAKTLESVASLCMESPAYYPTVCRKALQGALSLLKKQDSLDVSRLSKCLHSLLKLSLPERLVDLENCDQEEAWKYYEEALSVISTIENYPEVETLWLMTQAWNTGIFMYSLRKYTDAERWCALAMRLLSYLGSLRTSYESKMAGLYSDILDKLDKARGDVCETYLYCTCNIKKPTLKLQLLYDVSV
ncbi:testis-expressed protein 11 [Gastrophryne carolinensis]